MRKWRLFTVKRREIAIFCAILSVQRRIDRGRLTARIARVAFFERIVYVVFRDFSTQLFAFAHAQRPLLSTMRYISLPSVGVLWMLGVLLIPLMGCNDSAPPSSSSSDSASEQPIALAIHGGAGTISPENMTDDQEAAYRTALNDALDAGYTVLEDGGSSLDAVEAAIVRMEDDSLFNAARGAVFTNEDRVELDASIMDGATRNAGALTGVTTVRNPIRLARTIMTESPHVMMAGAGAEAFADGFDLERVENSYFHTERRLEAAQHARESATSSLRLSEDENQKLGTVGAVALDRDGNLAAGTSTGGMTNKQFGRVGDSPIIGAGTYAHNATCAVSSTGHGEYFMRGVVAHDIAARMQYGNQSLTDAANAVVHDMLPDMGGSGGVISLDAEGTVAMPFNTSGMYRASVDASGERVVRIYGNEEEAASTE
mgnify:CR=1 FL=1